MFICKLLGTLIPPLYILNGLANVDQDGYDSVKAVALLQERYAYRGIQASRIGQHYFSHSITAFVEGPSCLNVICSCGSGR
ncbi:Uncharacterised protein [uncultured archaeon]|nr:Uncharacterised protein [uncultured archaeon]